MHTFQSIAFELFGFNVIKCHTQYSTSQTLVPPIPAVLRSNGLSCFWCKGTCISCLGRACHIYLNASIIKQSHYVCCLCKDFVNIFELLQTFGTPHSGRGMEKNVSFLPCKVCRLLSRPSTCKQQVKGHSYCVAFPRLQISMKFTDSV